jgi:hypothetical protein
MFCFRDETELELGLDEAGRIIAILLAPLVE